MSAKGSVFNGAFWFHLLITVISWIGPFLFDWRLMVTAYAIVQLQFIFLGKCVVNKHHDLDETDNYTFYAFLFEQLGFDVNRQSMHFYVRKISNWFYAAIAIIWQVVLEIEPLFF